MNYNKFVYDKKWESSFLRKQALFAYVEDVGQKLEIELETIIQSSTSSSGKSKANSKKVAKSNDWFSRIPRDYGKRNMGHDTFKGKKIVYGVIFMRAINRQLIAQPRGKVSAGLYEKSHKVMSQLYAENKGRDSKKGSSAIWF